MTEAYRRVWKGASAKRLRERFGVLGMVRSLECTHSEKSGWHPHIHVIIFMRADADVEAFGNALRELWERAAAVEGLEMNEHGFDIMDSTARVAEYITKWGREPRWREADELARWHTKQGRATRSNNGHYSPWQLLEFADQGDEQAGERWKEYALTFYRRKQLHWSPGLRDTLGLSEEISDEEAAEKEMEDATEEYLLNFTEEQWAYIKGNDLRIEMLELVEEYGAADIVEQCQEKYGILPTLLIPGPAPGLEDEEENARVSRLVDLVVRLQARPDQRIRTPAGVGIIGTVMYFEKLNRWRCSVWLDEPDGQKKRYRHFDLAEVRIA
jgi:hypothetical protein